MTSEPRTGMKRRMRMGRAVDVVVVAVVVIAVVVAVATFVDCVVGQRRSSTS